MRRLPPAALGSTLAAGAFSAWAHWFPIDANAVAVEKYVRMVDAMAAGWACAVCSLAAAAAIGCAVVMILKGPHYRADSYPLPDRDHPPES